MNNALDNDLVITLKFLIFNHIYKISVLARGEK